MQRDLAAGLREVARALTALADMVEHEASPTSVVPPAPDQPEAGTEAEVARLRGLKARNVSWAQIRRGAESLLGHETEVTPSPARNTERSLARRLAQNGGLSVEALLDVLDRAELGR